MRKKKKKKINQQLWPPIQRDFDKRKKEEKPHQKKKYPFDKEVYVVLFVIFWNMFK